jgi:hypothetical protein
MKKDVFVANLPEGVTPDDLKGLFEPAGEIEAVEFEPNPILNGVSARVTMVTEKAATRARNTLNGQSLQDRRIAVSVTDLGERNHLSDKQQKTVEQIAAVLGETEEVPLRQLTAIVMLCGTNFAEAILHETELVESSEGIATVEGDRRRTKGGVFFYLARHRMAKPIRAVVYNRKGKLPERADGNGDSEK